MTTIIITVISQEEMMNLIDIKKKRGKDLDPEIMLSKGDTSKVIVEEIMSSINQEIIIKKIKEGQGVEIIIIDTRIINIKTG
jgi:hypothetical protein